MKYLIKNEIQNIQKDIDALDTDSLDLEIQKTDKHLNELLVARSNVLKQKESLQKEVDFLNAMITKCDELQGIPLTPLEPSTPVEDNKEESEVEYDPN